MGSRAEICADRFGVVSDETRVHVVLGTPRSTRSLASGRVPVGKRPRWIRVGLGRSKTEIRRPAASGGASTSTFLHCGVRLPTARDFFGVNAVLNVVRATADIAGEIVWGVASNVTNSTG